MHLKILVTADWVEQIRRNWPPDSGASFPTGIYLPGRFDQAPFLIYVALDKMYLAGFDHLTLPSILKIELFTPPEVVYEEDSCWWNFEELPFDDALFEDKAGFAALHDYLAEWRAAHAVAMA